MRRCRRHIGDTGIGCEALQDRRSVAAAAVANEAAYQVFPEPLLPAARILADAAQSSYEN
jgi:hypothetical protein